MSVNQNIKPVTTKYSDKGIEIGGCALSDLAQKYGTPLYVIDETTIREVAKEYKNTFKEYKNIKMLHALKSLCTLASSKILMDEGFGFDAVSYGEIFTLKTAGADMSNVVFNGNNKSKRELEYAIEVSVGRISVDNFYEAELLNKLAETKGKVVDILLRVTPGIECHTHDYIQTGQIDSKFGFDLTQLDEIVSLILNKHKNLNIKGLHAHIGSQIFEPVSYSEEIKILIKEIKYLNKKYNLDLNELNIGGGLGVKYTENDLPPSIQDVGNAVINALGKDIDKYIVYLEPGRSIVSTSGVTVYTVGSSKQVPNGRKYIATDGGMADNPRPSLYQAKYTAEAVLPKSDEKEIVTIVGRYCESGDVLIENIELPKLNPNDLICIYNTGAYNYSMASNYNKTEKPAMVLVNNSQSDMIVYRESVEDLIAKECIPDRLR